MILFRAENNLRMKYFKIWNFESLIDDEDFKSSTESIISTFFDPLYRFRREL